MFSDDDSENESVHQLTVNEHYAKAFQYKKEREELEKLKEKYGSDFEDEESESDSESAESEDEDGEELTPAVDAAILRTLAKIKRKDPAIYDKDKGVFQEEQTQVSTKKLFSRAPKDKSKPVRLRQVALESALNTVQSRSPSPKPLTHVEEQQVVREELLAAAAVDDGSDDDLLVLREKTKDEIEQEEEEYRDFLQREVGTDIKQLVTVDSNANIWEEHQTKGSKATKKGTRKNLKRRGESRVSNELHTEPGLDRSLFQSDTDLSRGHWPRRPGGAANSRSRHRRRRF